MSPQLAEAKAILESAGYRVTFPKPKLVEPRQHVDGRTLTTKWPPRPDEHYAGKWPPEFCCPKGDSNYKTPTWMRLPDDCAPLPADWIERTRRTVFFVSRHAIVAQAIKELVSAKSNFLSWSRRVA